MYPNPMTNHPDRVAPDHPIQLPGPTLVRPRRPIAASVLSVLLGLSCFAASPAWAYRAGGGNDRPSVGIPEYETFAAYLRDTNRDKYRHVKIGDYTFVVNHMKAFRQGKTLTSVDQLIKSYNDVAAYLADSTRTTRLYANIGSEMYRVTDLEARNTPTSPLSNLNLPHPIQFPSVAVGQDAHAGYYGSTAIGVNARTGRFLGEIAIGRHSYADGGSSTAVGAGADADGGYSIAVGAGADADGGYSIAVGAGADADGGRSTAVGAGADADGGSSIALGHRSHARYDYSIALGHFSFAGENSIALGNTAWASGEDSIALGRGARATGDKGIAIGSGSGVSAGASEVIIGTSGHTYKLPGLAPGSGTTKVVTVDSNGRLSTQTTTTGTASSRGAALRGAAGLSSEVTAVSRTEAADYEKAPAIGSGPTAPATAEQRRVVVQDTNRDGSVRLRTLDFGDLSGMEQRLAGVDRRVTSLSERLNRATAMSSALSALPNVVPGDNRFFLGVGAGHYSSEQALAIGMSARVQSRVFVNAGVALASGDEVSVRGGVGVVW